MNQAPTTNDTPVTSSRFGPRAKLLIVVACFAVPLLLAIIWLQIVKSRGGDFGVSARGELIRPAFPLPEFSVNQVAGKSDTFTHESLRGIWTMLYAPEGECLQVCQRNLYHMRQVRLSLNNRKDRVQRAVMLDSENQLEQVLLDEHLGLRVLWGDQKAFMAPFIEAEGKMTPSPDAIYLIDPFGNLMMRFPTDLDPKSMLKDIKHLLKVSRIG